MALRIPLAGDDTAGLDRLVVLGVRPTSDAAEGARRIARLLDAHHYTGGVALVAPGTPTNNTSTARSGWGAVDEGYDASWRWERGVPSVASRRRVGREPHGAFARGAE